MLPAYPAFSLFFLPPIPPTPFPGGEGGAQGYFMQGASPLASPGLNPGGTGAGAYRALEERLAPTFFFPCLDRRGGL